MNSAGPQVSREFFDLIKFIGEARSKQEEDRIIANEVVALKQRMGQPKVSTRRMQEYIIRSLYVELLGHSASFAHIHAVNLANQQQAKAKWIGYLACNLFLHQDHELMLLLVNTIQKDLRSPNVLYVQAALCCVCRVLTLEMLPAVVAATTDLLQHPLPAIRRKCVILLHKIISVKPPPPPLPHHSHHCQQQQQEVADEDCYIIPDLQGKVRRALCDGDPSVMGASLHVLRRLTSTHKAQCVGFIPSLVSILKQILDRRLPRDYDYHRAPAPWIQMSILSLLSILAAGDPQLSSEVYLVVEETMRRADCSANVGFALVYSSVCTAAAVYPQQRLLAAAAAATSKFLLCSNNNLRFVGVAGLAALARVSPGQAANHQLAIIDCLEDADETLKHETLNLLTVITNPSNVAFVVDSLFRHLRAAADPHLRAGLVSRVAVLAERFSPNPKWFVSTVLALLEVGGVGACLGSAGAAAAAATASTSSSSSSSTAAAVHAAQSLLQLVADGTDAPPERDREFRVYVVNAVVLLLKLKKQIPDILVQVACWVLGEFGSLCSLPNFSQGDLLALLRDASQRSFESGSTRGWVLWAMVKLSALHAAAAAAAGTAAAAAGAAAVSGLVLQQLQQQQKHFAATTDVQERCFRGALLLQLLPPKVLGEVFPFDAATEDIPSEAILSIGQSFAAAAVRGRAAAYVPPCRRPAAAAGGSAAAASAAGSLSSQAHHHHQAASLNFTPYAPPPPAAPRMQQQQQQHQSPPQQLNPQASPAVQSSTGLQVQGPRRWGPFGFVGCANGAATAAAAPEASASSSSSSSGSSSWQPHAAAAAVAAMDLPRQPQYQQQQQQQQQREMTERERMAAALFGGFSGDTAAAAAAEPAVAAVEPLNGGMSLCCCAFTGISSALSFRRFARP